MAQTRVVAVRVGFPGTAEHHITDFKLDTSKELSKSEMIYYVQMTPKTYYSYADGKLAYLEVAKTADGVPYVRTHSDSTPDNNLLNLPRF